MTGSERLEAALRVAAPDGLTGVIEDVFTYMYECHVYIAGAGYVDFAVARKDVERDDDALTALLTGAISTAFARLDG